MICPRCGTPDPGGGRFCQACGHDFAPPVAMIQEKHRDAHLSNRTTLILAILLPVVVLSSIALSPLLMSSHSPERDIVVEPNSYYSVHFEFYGIGMLKYSEEQIDGPQMYLIQLDKANYEHFVSGEDYDYTMYGVLASGGSGEATETGTIWVEYLVFVNDNAAPATFRFGYDVDVTVSLLVAGPLLAAYFLVLLIAVAVNRVHARAR